MWELASAGSNSRSKWRKRVSKAVNSPDWRWRPCEAASSNTGAREGRGVGLGLRGEEDGDAGDQERLWQTLDDGVNQGAEVGLRVEGAAKVDQGLAVVEALLIEEAINPALDGALERVEDESGDKDDRKQAPEAEFSPGGAGAGLWQRRQ